MYHQVADFIVNLKWTDWLTIVGFLFGIVTLIAYIDQRRSAKGNKALIKWAELNLDKSISESEIKELFSRKKAMEEEISKNVPLLARVAVLKEQAELHRQAVAEHFSTWQKLSEELENSVALPGIDPQIKNTILDLIIPKYQKDLAINNIRSRITVLSVGIAVASAILPFGLGSIVVLSLAPALVSAAIRLHALTKDPEETYKFLIPWFHIAYGLVVVVLGGIGVLFLRSDGVTEMGRYIGWILCTFSGILLVAYPFTRKKISHYLASLTGTGKE